MSNIEMSDISGLKHVRQDAYAQYRLKHVLESGPLIILLPAAFNLLMLFVDLSMIHDQTSRDVILSVRVLYTLLCILLLANLGKINSFRVFGRIITAMEIMCIAIFLYVLSSYPAPDFLIQSFGVITIVLTVFLIPNAWSNIIIVVGILELSFLIFSAILLPGLDPMKFGAGAVFITIDSILCAFFAWNRQKSQSLEFDARQELQRQSSTDYLTQATTRFKLEEEAERWIIFCRRQDIPLSMVFVDIDDLKPINDKYGHAAGDKVLSEIVVRMSANLRKSDIVARWGGDEFILLLPDSDLNKSVEISESIRQAIENKMFSKAISVTCSFGVTSMNDKSTFETMIREADDLMYKSKKLGKNRIESGGIYERK